MRKKREHLCACVHKRDREQKKYFMQTKDIDFFYVHGENLFYKTSFFISYEIQKSYKLQMHSKTYKTANQSFLWKLTKSMAGRNVSTFKHSSAFSCLDLELENVQ